jgi:hypothetical protein
MAEQDFKPDKFSDHDFFLITKQGAQSEFKNNFEWLPDSDNIIYYFQESEYAVKVLYNYGHIAEFGVVDRGDLKEVPLNNYRILIDKDGREEQIHNLAKKTEQDSQLITSNERLVGQIIFDLKIGIDRFLRGEKLSAFKKIKCLCIENLLILIQKNINTKQKEGTDNLDPFRRVELQYPTFGQKIEDVLSSSLYEVSLTILFFLKNEFNIKLDENQKKAVEILIEYLNDNKDKLANN